MKRVLSLVVLSLIGAAGAAAADQGPVRTRAGFLVRRTDDGQRRVSEYSRGGAFVGRVTTWRDGRIVVERAIHGSLSTHYRIQNFPRPVDGVVRILEWNKPGDRGGLGKISFYADGTRR